MRIWFIACLQICLVLPAGAEPPSPEITPEEAKSIAKEMVDHLRAHLARQRKNRGEDESPSEGSKGFDPCSSDAELSKDSDLRAEHFPLRTDHLKPCPNLWRVLDVHGFGFLSWFISVPGYPHGDMTLTCNKRHPTGTKWELHFFFKDYWLFQRYNTNLRRPRNKKERVHLQLGLWSQVEAAEEGEGFTLKQATIDFKWPNRSKRISDLEQIHRVNFFDEEAFDLMRQIYHSEVLSWTDLRTGETNSILTGELARSAIDEMLGHCGYSLTDAGTSSPSQASQR